MSENNQNPRVYSGSIKELTEQSTERLLRRTALIQSHTGALARDAASLSAFMATGGDSEYSRRFGEAVALWGKTEHTPQRLAQRIEAKVRSRATPGLRRDQTPGRADIALRPQPRDATLG
jgi:hypothetical protein